MLAQAGSELGHGRGEAIEQFVEGHRRAAQDGGLAFENGGLVDLVGIQGVRVQQEGVGV